MCVLEAADGRSKTAASTHDSQGGEPPSSFPHTVEGRLASNMPACASSATDEHDDHDDDDGNDDSARFFFAATSNWGRQHKHFERGKRTGLFSGPQVSPSPPFFSVLSSVLGGPRDPVVIAGSE